MSSPASVNVTQPLKVIYIDQPDGWSSPQEIAGTVTAAVDAGFNVVILAFYLTSGPTDMAVAWQGLGAALQQSTAGYAHQKGAVVLVSAGGATESPYTLNATTYGQTVAQWAQTNNLDGVDFDLENLGTGFTFGAMSGDQVVAWMVAATKAARAVFPAGTGYISHAPQAPYIGPVGGDPQTYWAGTSGGYTAVYLAGGIDFLNVQFYNQGAADYTTYASLFTQSSSDFPGTAVQQIAGYGIPLSAIVVGKPVQTSDANSGYVTPADLSTFFTQAAGMGWNAGVMGWQWSSSNPSITASWIQAIYPPGC